jgi:hypothetical protein
MTSLNRRLFSAWIKKLPAFLGRWLTISVNLLTRTEVSAVVPTTSPFSLILAAAHFDAGGARVPADKGAGCCAQALAKTIPQTNGSSIKARNGSKLPAATLAIILLLRFGHH